jgi:hypothetical protein
VHLPHSFTVLVIHNYLPATSHLFRQPDMGFCGVSLLPLNFTMPRSNSHLLHKAVNLINAYGSESNFRDMVLVAH